MAGAGIVTIGVRIVGESVVRWLHDDDPGFRPGDRVLIDGVRALVVVAADQVVGSVPPGAFSDSRIDRDLTAESGHESSEADMLDVLLGTFPQPGDRWQSETVSGIVTSINLKMESFTVRDKLTGETVTIPRTDESE